jgi:phosphohistidine phosphatase
MTKRLILTRHTKSSWDDPMTPDHDRPLNDRGKAAAADLGEWLASRGYVPETVLCSDAQRTRKTFSGIAPALPGAPVLDLKPALYHAGPDVMLAVMRHAKADTIMMIGHNPGIAEFATRLVTRAPMNPEFSRCGRIQCRDLGASRIRHWHHAGLYHPARDHGLTKAPAFRQDILGGKLPIRATKGARKPPASF